MMHARRKMASFSRQRFSMRSTVESGRPTVGSRMRLVMPYGFRRDVRGKSGRRRSKDQRWPEPRASLGLGDRRDFSLIVLPSM